MKFVFLLTSSTLASLCSNTSFPFANKTISIPLVPITTPQLSSNGSVISPPEISGVIEISSGCAFTVKNFTFTPVGSAVYTWLGVEDKNASLADRLVSENLSAVSMSSVSYNLLQDFSVAPPVSFYDISAIEIFEEASDIVWASAVLPNSAGLSNATLVVNRTKDGVAVYPGASSGCLSLVVALPLFLLLI